jgi:hypothetical protein
MDASGLFFDQFCPLREQHKYKTKKVIAKIFYYCLTTKIAFFLNF